MTVRRQTMFGGERYLKNRHKKDPWIRIALKQVSDARKILSDAVQLKNNLIKKSNEEWKKLEVKPRMPRRKETAPRKPRKTHTAEKKINEFIQNIV